MQLLDLRRDPSPLVALVCRQEHGDLVAVGGVGEQVLGLARAIVRDDGVGRVEDIARRAVVLLELDRLRLGPVALEVEDVADVGTAPRVDGLVVVADDHEVSVAAREHLRDLVLCLVGVLVLVDQDVPETAPVLVAHVGVVTEQDVRVEEQVVEVERVGPQQPLLVGPVDAGDGLVRGVADARHVAVGADELVFGRGDTRAHGVLRKRLRVVPAVGHDGFDQALGVVGVVDREVFREPQPVGICPEHAHAHAVERVDPHAADAGLHELVQPLAHLGRGLVRERDRQDVPGCDAQVFDEVRDTVREHARLAGSGTRQHEQGPFGRLHCLSLRRVE